MSKYLKNKKFIAGAIISGIIILIAFIGLFYTPYSPTEMNQANKFAGVSIHHILGCDNFGRDIFSRVMIGINKTVFIAFGTNLIGLFFGITIGAFTGYFGGIADEVLMRINDSVLAFPSILLALVIISLFGTGEKNVMIALGIVFIPSYARMVRGEYIKYKNMDYCKSAKLIGASDLRIMFVHIFPNTLPVIFTTAVIGFNNAVLAEAGLSFLGIGSQPPNSSLGNMLSDSQTYIFSHPGYSITVGAVIVILIIGFALLSDGIKETLKM